MGSTKFDWREDVTYDYSDERRESGPGHLKQKWHSEMKKRLAQLADALGYTKGTYNVSSNMGGVGVSGEVMLTTPTLYVQFEQGAMLQYQLGILFRRADAAGGDKYGARYSNHWAPGELVDDIPALAARIRNEGCR